MSGSGARSRVPDTDWRDRTSRSELGQTTVPVPTTRVLPTATFGAPTTVGVGQPSR
jgi:hypothetical protein